MKKVVLLVVLLIILPSLTLSQTYIPPGDVSGIWLVNNSPFYIQGDITIPNDSSLIIEPGVLVEFQGYYALNVQGRLLANGTETNNITFTIDDTTGFYNPDTTQGGWNGIQFIDTPNENDTSKIIYCTLQYGKAVGSNPPDNSGGAIFVSNFNKVLISNSLITHNSAGGTNSPCGGAIRAQFADITLSDNEISHNRAYYGGAINFNECYVQINNCEIKDNSSAWIGGGINAYSCYLEINNTSFERDTAYIFGGAMGIYNSELTINHSLLMDNSSGILGGGIHSDYSLVNIKNTIFEKDTSGNAGGGIFTWQSSLNVEGCEFINNSATINGGAVSSSNCHLLIDSCMFYQNIAGNEAGAIECFIDTSYFTEKLFIQINNSEFLNNSSGNLYAGVKIRQDNSDTALCSVRMDNNLFKGNTANSYSAIRFIGNIDDIIVNNSIFEENFTNQITSIFSANGGAKVKVNNSLFSKNYPRAASLNLNARIDFMNCTFANNYGTNSSGLSIRNNAEATLTNSILWNNGNNPILIVNVGTNGSILTINHSDVQFGPDSLIVPDSLSILNWGTGNIDLDPLFADILNNDFHLQESSPCIAAGIDSIQIGGFWYYCPSTDIEGNPRPDPVGTTPDIGAYESQFPVRFDDQNLDLPTQYILHQNYPNPFNPSTKISWQSPVGSWQTLKIYDVLGNEVATLVDEYKPAGIYELEWDVIGLPSGVYFYQIKAESFIETKKMVLIK
ncbi:MAG: T9SS type A sorting domain-containing protein [Ignavibacteriaceae bacterium]|nr:T9SS type A sorting domain-containing protein [Ignavibacteriaceae bacterium]